MRIFYFFVSLTINLVSSQLTPISRQKNDDKRTTAHQYDQAGNITRLTNSSPAGTDTQTFTYDHLNRLITANASGGIAHYSHNNYQYDLIGNITYLGNNTLYDYQNWSDTCPQPIPTQTMPHAVRKIGNQYFCYDKNGNMTTRYDGMTLYTQNFNIENELTSVVVNGQTTSFTYDAAGMRVKTVQPNGSLIDTPFPDYEVENPGQPAQTIRITLSIAGQAVSPAHRSIPLSLTPQQFNCYTYTLNNPLTFTESFWRSLFVVRVLKRGDRTLPPPFSPHFIHATLQSWLK